jgi:NAD(P)-dependent dehydrogenase (short-subunit alcohol dehydrogenase family)
MKLIGRTAIITGAGRGIGRAISLLLAREGAQVVLVARSVPELAAVTAEIQESHGRAMAVSADVTIPIQVEEMVARALAQFGRLDILVNNAGGAGSELPVDELSLESWHDVLDSNLTSAFLCTRSVVPFMKECGGRIVNVSSVAAKTGLPYRAGYSAAKSGVIGFTRAMALELGPYQINVNCVVPGSVSGERLDRVIRGQAQREGLTPQAIEGRMKQKSPLGRLIPPEDVAAAVLWLVGPDGGNITGEDVNITAGAVMY